MGILYFIQPAELVGTNRYKVGCSTKNDLSRIKAYKMGTRMIMILECNDPFIVEQKIIQTFKEKFSKIAGNEYFEGYEVEMRKAFYDTFCAWEHSDDTITKLKSLISNVKQTEHKIGQLLEPNLMDSFKQMFEITNVMTDKVPSSKITDWIKGKDITMTKFGRDLNMYAESKTFHNVKSIPKKIGIKEIPLEEDEPVTKERIKEQPERPRNIYDLIQKKILFHHYKGKNNEYAITSGLPDGIFYACDSKGLRSGNQFKSLNDFTCNNYKLKNEREGTKRTLRNNAWIECRFMSKSGWMDCSILDLRHKKELQKYFE
jgi:hypothetical protein